MRKSTYESTGHSSSTLTTLSKQTSTMSGIAREREGKPRREERRERGKWLEGEEKIKRTIANMCSSKSDWLESLLVVFDCDECPLESVWLEF